MDRSALLYLLLATLILVPLVLSVRLLLISANDREELRLKWIRKYRRPKSRRRFTLLLRFAAIGLLLIAAAAAWTTYYLCKAGGSCL